jgi:hypothetical protein
MKIFHGAHENNALCESRSRGYLEFPGRAEDEGPPARARRVPPGRRALRVRHARGARRRPRPARRRNGGGAGRGAPARDRDRRVGQARRAPGQHPLLQRPPRGVEPVSRGARPRPRDGVGDLLDGGLPLRRGGGALPQAHDPALRRPRAVVRAARGAIFENPGHTAGTLNVELPAADLLHVGDTAVGRMAYLRYSAPEAIDRALERAQRRGTLADPPLARRGRGPRGPRLGARLPRGPPRARVRGAARARPRPRDHDRRVPASRARGRPPFESFFHARNLASIEERGLYPEAA